MLKLRAELKEKGSIVSDSSFYTLVLCSLPVSTQPIVSTIVTEAATAGTTVSIDELVSRIVSRTGQSGTALHMGTTTPAVTIGQRKIETQGETTQRTHP